VFDVDCVQTTNGVVPLLKPPPAVDGKCAAAAAPPATALPVYQPAAVTYQQMALAGMQLPQPAYVPITS